MNIIINFAAFCLPLLIFLFLGTIGYAALSILRSQRNLIQNILLAPAIGLAVILLSVFIFSRAGFPVNSFATPLSLGLWLSSMLVLWKKKPLWPWHHYLPFAGIFLVAYFLIGEPLLEFGFNWISYGNDDMTNYALGAQLLLKHGYSDIPNSTLLTQRQDYSLYYWFLHVIIMERAGSQLLLAWLSQITRLSTLQIFMPLIMTLHLIVISSTGAMVYQSKKWRRAALAACILLASSGLASLGTLYQLAAQVSGLCFLVTACTVLLQPFTQHQKNMVLKSGILLSLVSSALLIVYTELAPFLGTAFLLYIAISLLKGWRPPQRFFFILGLALVFSLILLNTYWANVIAIFNIQLWKLSFKKSALGALFPYFLIPSGMADLWNLQALARLPKDPWLSISILLGMALSLITIVMTMQQAFKKTIPAIMLAIMIALSFSLFKSDSGFALFKLIMYMQPFLVSVVAIGLFNLPQKKMLPVLTFSVLVLLGIYTQRYYVECSRGSIGHAFVELSNASESHFLHEVKNLARQLPTETSTLVIADTPNTVTAKILAYHLQGKKTIFYSDSFFTEHFTDNLLQNLSYYHNRGLVEKVIPHEFAAFINLEEDIAITLKKFNFSIYDPLQPGLKSEFIKPLVKLDKSGQLISSTPKREIFNRRLYLGKEYDNFAIIPIKKVANYLIFINSSLGQYYYLGNLDYISLYSLEKDYFYKNDTVVWLGRYLLFQIINPSSKTRIALNISTSLNHDGSNLLPPVQAIGKQRISFPIVGRGSARVFSPVCAPQVIDNTPYLMLDMAQTGKVFPSRPRGMMKLFGKQLFLDHRVLVGFARDISLISAEQYAKISPPSNLNQFPTDLANPDLEYSGMYEDGWISETAFFNLQQPQDKPELVVQGMLPLLSDKTFITELTIKVDAKIIATQKITPGKFRIQMHIPDHPGRKKVELTFSNKQSLPPGDDRPVAAKMEFIGFTTFTGNA